MTPCSVLSKTLCLRWLRKSTVLAVYWGAFIVVAESIAPEDGKDRSAWLCEGQGSPLARRGLVECARDMYARSVRRLSDD